MARVGFIGVGNMGSLMARNLIKAGHSLKVFDLNEEAVNFVVQSGAKRAASVKDAAKGVDFVVTMLPVGANVRAVFLGEGVIAAADKGTVLIDSSTIDVDSARAVHAAAAERGFAMLDAPVSGGVVGADAATLTFMCGGDKATFAKALPLLQDMGKNIVHCGGPGFGQVTKICNNMVAGIISLATAEAFVMGEKLGVARQTLYDVLSTSTASSTILTQDVPDARPGAELGVEQRLQAGLHGQADAEGPAALAGGRPDGRDRDAARRGRNRRIRHARRQRLRRPRHEQHRQADQAGYLSVGCPVGV